VEKTKVMKISRQPSPVTIMIDEKQLENMECFKYLGSIFLCGFDRASSIICGNTMPTRCNR
jgi:hypothetical protein